MELTYQDVLHYLDTLTRVPSEKASQKVLYAMIKNRSALESHKNVLEQARNALVGKYVARDEDGNPKIEGQMRIEEVELEDRAAFEDDLKALLVETVEVEIHTIPVSYLHRCEGPPMAFFALDWMLEVPANGEPAELSVNEIAVD